jgi:hypothetical protein
MGRALQGIGLVFLVVAVNLGLYVLIVWLANSGIIESGSSFPALALFLSFALSVGIILIVALGEKVDASNIQNEWIKKIGVTPIMVIVAAIIAIFASFTPLASNIFPNPPDPSLQLKFMLANLGVTCRTKDENKSPQATHLLTFIASADEDYIQDIKKFLADKQLMQPALNNQFTLVQPADEFSKLLQQYARSGQKGSESLQDDLRKTRNWVAYVVEAGDPEITTFVPLPSIFEKSQSSRLFVVITDRAAERDPQLAALVPTGAPEAVRKKVLPLFQVDISPKRPRELSQLTNLDFSMFADHICWQIGASS